MRRFFLISTIILVAWSTNAQQLSYNDIVYMKDGVQFQCRVLVQSPDSVWFKYSWSEDLHSLAQNQISKIDISSTGTIVTSTPVLQENRPSYYLQRCGDQFALGIGISVVGGLVGGLIQGSGTASGDEGIVLMGSIITIGAEIVAFICECRAISNLRKAGRAMERITINSNGVSIAL